MSSIRKSLCAALVCALFLSATPARAEGGDYAEATLPNIIKMFVRFGVYDIRKDNAIDFYGKVVECKIFRDNYIDDFKWQRVRTALRESIKQNIAAFPTGVRYDAELQLGKYDFHEGIYRFSEKTAQFNANVFVISIHSSNFCTRDTPNLLPSEYRFVLDQPVHIAGIPMSESDGSKLLAKLREAGNKDLVVYTRFNMRVTYIAPLEAPTQDAAKGKGDFVLAQPRGENLRIDTHLDSIEYFEDPERTKLIYRFMP